MLPEMAAVPGTVPPYPQRWAEVLAAGLEQMQLADRVSISQQNQLLIFLSWLHKWNKAYNLTSVRDPLEMIAVHLLDSLSLLPHLTGQRFIDVGTGPGLPGIPLAIALPENQFVLLDSAGKRVRFMFQVIHALGLKNAHEVQSRVESYHPEQSFDGVISRAFTALPEMVAQCRHLLQPGGRYFAMKGKLQDHELEHLPNGCKVDTVYPLRVAGVVGERHLICLSDTLH